MSKVLFLTLIFSFFSVQGFANSNPVEELQNIKKLDAEKRLDALDELSGKLQAFIKVKFLNCLPIYYKKEFDEEGIPSLKKKKRTRNEVQICRNKIKEIEKKIIKATYSIRKESLKLGFEKNLEELKNSENEELQSLK